MGEGVREKPCSGKRALRLYAVATTVVLLAVWHASSAVAQGGPRYGTDDLLSVRSIESIVKEAEDITYPPDDFYRVVQERIPKSSPFPCDRNDDKPKWRSDTRPTSVHELRPGDIDVVAAMGDSLMSGNAARERSAWGLLIADRGVSFGGGGESTWHQITTLPNIIKMFNPNLIGQALGRGDFLSYNAQLNVAVPGSLDGEIMNQIRIFMKKIRRDKRIDFRKDWKLLTISIGHNNICSMECSDKASHTPELHKLHLQEALDYLYENVPRIFVNIVSVLDPTIQQRIPISTACQFLSRAGCNCMYKENDLEDGMAQLSRVVRQYQQAEKELVNSGRYEGKEDFTVELQPYSLVLNAPVDRREPDKPKLLQFIQNELPIWTPDCFHFNQRGMAEVTIQLWNNMLEPVGNKSEKIEDMELGQYKCPTKDKPYFFTKKNSETFYKEGHQ